MLRWLPIFPRVHRRYAERGSVRASARMGWARFIEDRFCQRIRAFLPRRNIQPVRIQIECSEPNLSRDGNRVQRLTSIIRLRNDRPIGTLKIFYDSMIEDSAGFHRAKILCPAVGIITGAPSAKESWHPVECRHEFND